MPKKTGIITTIRPLVTPTLEALGFHETTLDPHQATWQLQFDRPAGAGSLELTFFRNTKFSTPRPDRGSEFAIAFRFTHIQGSYDTFFHLLAPEAKEQCLATQNTVLTRMGAPTLDRFPRGWDVLMRYREQADLVLWANFISEHIESALTTFTTSYA